MQRRTRGLLFAAAAVAAVAAMALLPRIPQDPQYHNFADRRPALGAPNFGDVASNLPFLIAGLWGLLFVGRSRDRRAFSESFERWPYFVFFLGVTLTCFGSSYYHWNPGNGTLVWDRLPITVSFVGIFAGTIADRIGARAGQRCLAPLLAAGAATVVYWRWTELHGVGDLRPYVAVQVFPLLAIPLLLVLFPARYTRSGALLTAGGFYALAKVLELLDQPIYRLAGISGHTLKHLAAAMAAFWILRMLKMREVIKDTGYSRP